MLIRDFSPTNRKEVFFGQTLESVLNGRGREEYGMRLVSSDPVILEINTETKFDVWWVN